MQRQLILWKTTLFHGKVISPISELYEDTKIIPFTRRELKKEIKKLNKKTSIDQDGISNRILKLIPDSMIELILLLFNKCLLYGKIPKYWKQSRITMIGKKGSDRRSVNGYRPISIIPCLSRLFER